MTNPSEVLFKTSANFQELIGNVDEALRQNLELLIRSIGCDRAAIFLLDEKEQVLSPHADSHHLRRNGRRGRKLLLGQKGE